MFEFLQQSLKMQTQGMVCVTESKERVGRVGNVLAEGKILKSLQD